MSHRKIFLVFLFISTVSLLLHHGGHLNWTMDAFHLSCPAPRPHPAWGLKPKHTNVAFLKTHKTASSTMQNVLFRFAERHNLTVALPIQACGHQFCYPKTFMSQFVHPHTLPPNIITNHMRFNRAELQRLMPNDTVYITILREPGTMFESLFSYYMFYSSGFKTVPNHSLETFLDNPNKYYQPTKKNVYEHNTVTYDLGGDNDRPAEDTDYARAFVAEVERVFSLVMIAEYFDESLVVLRHLLSWDLDDILYFKLNMRSTGSKRSLTPALAAKIRGWNALDARLYDHFNASLWRRVSALGQDCVAREVQLLRQAQKRLMESCFGEQKPLLRSPTQIKNKDLRPWQPNEKVEIVGYDLPVNLSRSLSAQAHELCLKLIMPEVSYSQALLRSQLLRYRRKYQHRPDHQPRSQIPPRTRRPASPPAAPAAAAAAGTGSISEPATGNQGRTTMSGLKSSQSQASD